MESETHSITVSKTNGKNPQGRTRVNVKNIGKIRHRIKDDGKGIDPEDVVTKTVESGIISVEKAGNLSREEKINLICAPGFSTAETT